MVWTTEFWIVFTKIGAVRDNEFHEKVVECVHFCMAVHSGVLPGTRHGSDSRVPGFLGHRREVFGA